MKVVVWHDAVPAGERPDPVLADIGGALERGGHEVLLLAAAATGHAAASELTAVAPDLVFNLTESYNGKSALDASLAGLLNLLDLRYTGSSHTGLTLAGDKSLTKMLLSFHGVPTPQFATLHRGALQSVGELGFPLIVKPPQEDASIGITSASVVRTPGELLERMDGVHREHNSPVLVEAFVEGREFYVGVLGNERVEPLPVAELDMSSYPPDVPRVASWNAKWEKGTEEYAGSTTTFPHLPPELVERMQEVAVRAFRALRLRDYARIDLRVSKTGEPFVIEVNPNCYLREGEVFAAAAARAGLTYHALVARIVELAAARYAR